MKPRRRTNTVRRAAREKIASDLAHDLSISVPPVILADRADPGSEEPHVAVSLVMFPRQDSWEIVRRALERASSAAQYYRAALPKLAARAWAFDTWLGQRDHTDETPDNIVFGFDPGDLDNGRFLFLDYAFSMGHLGRWDGDGVNDCSPALFPGLMRADLDRGELRRAVGDIERMESATIESIVARVPVSHLDGQEKEAIVAGLVKRQPLLRAAFTSAGAMS